MASTFGPGFRVLKPKLNPTGAVVTILATLALGLGFAIEPLRPIGLVGLAAVGADLLVALLNQMLYRSPSHLRGPTDATVGAVVTFEAPAPRHRWAPGPSGGRTLRIDTACVERGVRTGMVRSQTWSGQLGLAAIQRISQSEFSEPLYVAPAPRIHPDAADLLDRVRARTDRPWQTFDIARGARSYQPGDQLRHVHGPASARTGMLMTREFDREPDPSVLVLIVDLGRSLTPESDRVAGQALWLAGYAEAQGMQVHVVTRQPDGWQRTGPGDSHLGRALATACAGAPPPKLAGQRGSWILLTALGAFLAGGDG